MAENSYAQLLDDYEDGIEVIEGETFDEYQKRMGGIDYNAYGGLTGMGYANGGGVGSMMQPKKNFKMQGGVRNYLGDQKQVKAPLNWQSSPDHPKTELAYITKKEKDLLIKKDLHNSLKGSANKGPSGIISLNGFGSNDPGQNVGGGDISSAETGGGRSGMSQKDAQDFRSAAINAGAGQRVNPGFFDSRTFLSPEETARAKAYRNDPRNTFANQSFRNTGQSGIMNFIKSGGLMGNLVRSLGQRFGFGKKYDDTSTSISGDFNNNLGLGGIDTTPTSTRFKDFKPRVGNDGTMPPANITGLSNNDFDGVQNVDRSITSGQIDEFQNQLGGMNNNDYDIGNPGGMVQPNDYEMGDPSQYATADMINEFQNQLGGVDNNDFGVGNPGSFATADMIDEFGNGRLAGNSNEGFVNDPYATSDQGNLLGVPGDANQGFVNDPYGSSDDFINVESIINNGTPLTKSQEFYGSGVRPDFYPGDRLNEIEMENGVVTNNTNRLVAPFRLANGGIISLRKS